jgi:CO dehydrogenase/acetyl-CoA synthase beta subunit
MRVFHPIIEEIRDVIASRSSSPACRTVAADLPLTWPAAGPRDIVLLPDLSVELGPPETPSLSFLVWTEDETLVRPGAIHVIGPDIPESEGARLPFGKAVIVRTRPWDEEESYRHYLDMDLVRFDVSLKGYMIRAASHRMREWTRISREAVSGGFSFRTLGSALINALKALPMVVDAEVVFVTDPDGVEALREPCERAVRLVAAMNRMTEEADADCGSCDYQDVCSDAGEMQALRERLARGKAVNQ